MCNCKKGAAFGQQLAKTSAGYHTQVVQVRIYISNSRFDLVDLLLNYFEYRYQFDPSPRIRQSMTFICEDPIWSTLFRVVNDMSKNRYAKRRKLH